MKRLLSIKGIAVIVIFVAFLAAMFVPDTLGQTRRKRWRGWKTNAVIVGGGTVAGALLGGKKGAAMGAGAGLLYATSRRGTKRNYANSKYRRGAKIAGGALLGGGLGAYGGKTGALIGAAAGAGATYLYTRNGRRFYRARNGRVYSVTQ